jgi:ribosomal protein L29
MNSSMDAVARETRIEELEDEIKELEQELSAKQ